MNTRQSDLSRLKSFLKHHGVYEAFLANNHRLGYTSHDTVIEEKDKFIVGAFTWLESFWSDLNTKWTKSCREPNQRLNQRNKFDKPSPATRR